MLIVHLVVWYLLYYWMWKLIVPPRVTSRRCLGRTTVIVAHRLSTVQNADKIYCIKKGIVEEAGTHAELMEIRGLYCEIVGMQLKDVTVHNGMHTFYEI